MRFNSLKAILRQQCWERLFSFSERVWPAHSSRST